MALRGFEILYWTEENLSILSLQKEVILSLQGLRASKERLQTASRQGANIAKARWSLAFNYLKRPAS